MSRVYFYLPRCNSISTPLSEFVVRWNEYAKSLKKIGVTGSSVTLLMDDSVPENTWGDVSIVRLRKNRIIQFFQLAIRFKRKNGKATLIAGNNYDALMSVIFLRKLNPKLKVQASLHVEIDAIRASAGLKATFKKYLLKKLIPMVDSLRLVRAQEIIKAQEFLGVAREQIVVCPIPITIPEDPIGPRGQGIGYLGRIHAERSPFFWSEVALAVSELEPTSLFFVAGSGPDERDMRSLLSPLGSNVKFLGFITGSELKDFWLSIKVLLVTAPFESYGMAAREALLHGVMIVAPRLDTYLEIEQIAPSLVKLYLNKKEAVSHVLSGVNVDLKAEEVAKFREFFRASQDEQMKSLAYSWL